MLKQSYVAPNGILEAGPLGSVIWVFISKVQMTIERISLGDLSLSFLHPHNSNQIVIHVLQNAQYRIFCSVELNRVAAARQKKNVTSNTSSRSAS